MSDRFDDFIKDNLIETNPANQDSFKAIEARVLEKHRQLKTLKTTAFSLFFAALCFNAFYFFQQSNEGLLTASDHDFLEDLFAFEDENLSDDEDVLLWEVSL